MRLTRRFLATVSFAAVLAVLLLSLSSSSQPRASLAVPANDNFASAITITTPTISGIVATGNSAGATTEAGEPTSPNLAACPGFQEQAYAATVWYNWTAPETRTYVFDTYGSEISSALAIYTGGTVNTLTLVKCNRDFPGVSGDDSAFEVAATQGTTYRIQVGDVGSGGNLVLSMSLGAEMFVTGASPGYPDGNNANGVLVLREAMLLAGGGSGVTGLNRVPDSGESSAILNLAAAGHSSSDVVHFSGGLPSATTIASALPSLEGADVVTGIGRAGMTIAGAFDCFTMSGNSNRIDGLTIFGCQRGILVSGDDNVVGGTTIPAQRNHFRSNLIGIRIEPGASGNKVVGNTIGICDTCGPSLANDTGVLVLGDNNTIGGSAPGEGNQITGATSEGTIELVYFLGGSDNKLYGNRLGTTADGTAQQTIYASYSSLYGIRLEGTAQNNDIGGAGPGEGNVISSNGSMGLAIEGGATGNLVQGNKIGTDVSGTAALPNSVGVWIVNSSGNTIGGTESGQANVIAFNSGAGVRVGSGTGNSIRGNSIHSNGGLGIDLAPDGVTANDGAPDSDSGANNLQNFPKLTSGVSNGANISGTLSSTPNSGYNLDFYKSSSCDASGNGEGAVFIGTEQIGTDGSGYASFTFDSPIAIATGEFVTVTATRISTPFDTSEFSACPMVVDTNSDAVLSDCLPLVDNDCSLRGALTNAATAFTPGDLIVFDPSDFPPPPGAPGVITISSSLPSLNEPSEGDVIDATGRGVVIDGAGEPSAFVCFDVAGNGNILRGLQITDCSYGISVIGDNNVIDGNTLFDHSIAGISFGGGASGNLVVGNKVGTNTDGTAVHPDGGNQTGININGNGNGIGGSTETERNIISGNQTGISISGTGSDANVIKGNYVGTDVTGTVDLGNTANGINIAAATSNNVVGGTGPGEGNLISGNNQNGVRVNGSVAIGRPSGTMFLGNKIGTNAAGTAALANSRNGIIVDGATGTCIGGGVVAALCGAAAGGGNLISGNAWSGVQVSGDAGATGNRLFGNLIGTNATGTGPLGNGISGVHLGSSGNSVGGTGAGEANIIAFNSSDGVAVETATGNTIRGNSIHSNGLNGIGTYFGGNGEPGHAAPVIDLTDSTAGTACANCIVDVYSDDADEGRAYHGSVLADSGGNWDFPGTVSGPNITATATDGGGNTSKFSAPCHDMDLDGICSPADDDDDGDGFTDSVESGTPLCGNGINDDPFDDGVIDDGCPGGPSWVNTYYEGQFNIGTGSLDPCGNDGWPADLASGGIFDSTNRVEISDLHTFLIPRRLDTNPGDTNFDDRWDLRPGPGLFTDWINIGDLNALLTGSSGFPPMLGATRAFDGPSCPYPP